MTSEIFHKGLRSLHRRLADLVLPKPVEGYAEHSMIVPVQTGASAASGYLIDFALRSIMEARLLTLPELSRRVHASQIDFTPVWPGEHYRLLAAIVKLLQPKRVVEIGTLHGLSALALMKFLPEDGRITTFDITPWNVFTETCLSQSDFTDGRLIQHLGDLAEPAVFDRHRALIRETDLLFIDGPKDGMFERKFLRNLETVTFVNPLLVVFDDIRVWNMLAIWHEIAHSKLDITSFGHWSGTGLVEWKTS